MKEFETDYIEKLIDIMKNNEITEVSIGDENSALLIKSNGNNHVVNKKENPVLDIAEDEQEPEKNVEDIEQSKRVPIVSSMIGLYYAKPSPNDKPFVNVGDEIKVGQVVCIIETIKLMNKIASDVSGKVVEICIEDGQPVEYGQVIMYVEQN